jgi:hypothetical protein
MFLGNLLKTVMSGVQNAVTGAQGNPNNAFDRGYAANSPQAQQQQQAKQQQQQAQTQKTMSEADNEKALASINGIKAIQYEYQLKQLPQKEQQEHLDAISSFKDGLIKNGASIEAEGDDEKASDAQAQQLNGSDPRSTNHAGRFMSLPTMDSSGKAKFDVVYIPSKETLQEDLTGKDGEVIAKAGTPLNAVVGKFLAGQNEDIKDFIKDMHSSLGTSKPPETQDEADQRLAQLKSFVGIAGKTDPVWGKLAGDEMAAIQKNYSGLPKNQAELKKSMKDEGAGTNQLVENGKNPDGSPHMSLLNTKTGHVSEPVGPGAATLQKSGTNTPTSAMKTSAYRANTALAGIPDVINDIDRMGDKLGPVAGRWNEFMQGKIGADDPDFAGLRADMTMLSTAVTLAHAQGRMSDGLREDFERMINAPKQTPANIKATLGRVQNWMQRQANPNQINQTAANASSSATAPKKFDPSKLPDAQ